MTTRKLAALIAAGVLVLGGGVGVAAALDDAGSTGTDKAEEVVNASHGQSADHANTEHTTDGHGADDDLTVPADDSATAGADDSGTDDTEDSSGPSDNHGATVSAVARGTEPGPGHGEAVSAVARTNGGGSDDDSDDDEADELDNDDDNDDAGEDADDDADEDEDEDEVDNSGTGSQNSGPGSQNSGHDGDDD